MVPHWLKRTLTPLCSDRCRLLMGPLGIDMDGNAASFKEDSTESEDCEPTTPYCDSKAPRHARMHSERELPFSDSLCCSGDAEGTPVVPQIQILGQVGQGDDSMDALQSVSSPAHVAESKPGQVCTKACHGCCTSMFGGLWLWLYLVKKDEPCEHPLALWALVNSFSALALLGLSFISSGLKRKGLRASQGSKSYSPFIVLMSSIICIAAIFYLTWFIIGSVWTYGMPTGACDATLHNVCFWFITLVYSVVGLSLLYPCCKFCYSKTIARTQSPNV